MAKGQWSLGYVLAGAALAAYPKTRWLALWEGLWWLWRRHKRTVVFAQAQARARALGKPLIVVGAPDGGVTAGYGCGDVTIDIAPSSCPGALQADITKPLPFADDSAVVVVMCVLEYVDDANAALRELQRVAGSNLFVVRVEPWTLTAYLYPGAKRTLPCDGEGCSKIAGSSLRLRGFGHLRRRLR